MNDSNYVQIPVYEKTENENETNSQTESESETNFPFKYPFLMIYFIFFCLIFLLSQRYTIAKNPPEAVYTYWNQTKGVKQHVFISNDTNLRSTDLSLGIEVIADQKGQLLVKTVSGRTVYDVSFASDAHFQLISRNITSIEGISELFAELNGPSGPDDIASYQITTLPNQTLYIHRSINVSIISQLLLLLIFIVQQRFDKRNFPDIIKKGWKYRFSTGLTIYSFLTFIGTYQTLLSYFNINYVVQIAFFSLAFIDFTRLVCVVLILLDKVKVVQKPSIKNWAMNSNFYIFTRHFWSGSYLAKSPPTHLVFNLVFEELLTLTALFSVILDNGSSGSPYIIAFRIILAILRLFKAFTG